MSATSSSPRPRCFLVPSWTLWVEFSSLHAVALTVEAEYGSLVAMGGRYTAAHHQPNGSPYAGDHVVAGGRPAPCNDPNIPQLGQDGVVVLSHIDLDSVGGALRAFEEFQDLFSDAHASFWRSAGVVDVKGPHVLRHVGLAERDCARLQAWWAWSRKEIPRAPTDTVTEITEAILRAGEVLRLLLRGDREILNRGAEFEAAQTALNRETFVRENDGVIARMVQDDAFVNHLYSTPAGKLGCAVVTYNHRGVVTISRTESFPELDCRGVVQSLWGTEAGGHAGIAGSPRGRRMTWEDAERACAEVIRIARSRPLHTMESAVKMIEGAWVLMTAAPRQGLSRAAADYKRDIAPVLPEERYSEALRRALVRLEVVVQYDPYRPDNNHLFRSFDWDKQVDQALVDVLVESVVDVRTQG